MLDKEMEKKILGDINMNPKSLDEGVQHIQEWLTKQPHLPNTDDKDLLKGFIVGSKSVERAKERLDKYFRARTKCPAIFSSDNRDPNNLKWNEMQRMVVLPGLTPEGYHIIMMKVPSTKEEMQDFSFTETSRMFFNLTDYIIRNYSISSGQVVVIDSSGICMEYLTKFITSVTAAVFDIYQHVLPTRMKFCICINSSPITEIFCNKLLRVLLGEKLGKRVMVHSDDYKIVSKYFPIEMMPRDYGGKAPSYNELWDDTKKKLTSCRDWLISEGSKKSNEALRPKTDIDAEQLQGTFRKLEID